MMLGGRIERMWSLALVCVLLTAMSTGCHKSHHDDEPDEFITLRLRIESPEDATRGYDDPLDYMTEMQNYIDESDLHVIVYGEEDKITMIPRITPEIIHRIQHTLYIDIAAPSFGGVVSARVLANLSRASNFGATPEEVHKKLQEYVGKTDAELCDSLLANRFDKETGHWELGTKEEGNLMPMHTSRTPDKEITQSMELSMPLYRSVAKVHVEYKGTDKRIRITKLIVHNPMEIGAYISPYEPQLSPAIQYTDPFIPAKAKARSKYVTFDIENNAIIDQVYMAEQINSGTLAPYLEVLIEKDIYTEPKVEGEKPQLLYHYERWQPIYFTDNSKANGKPFNIIRNHAYLFRITEVHTTDLQIGVDVEWSANWDLDLRKN